MWNADEWLSFTQARDATGLTNFSWTPYTLSFSANPTITQTMMVPANFNGHIIQSVSNGSPVTVTGQIIKGVNVAFFDVAPGAHTYTVVYGVTTAVKMQDFHAQTDSDQNGVLAILGLTGLMVGPLALALLRRRVK
jgi:LPXTG-motif cell wall-anchored protein